MELLKLSCMTTRLDLASAEKSIIYMGKHICDSLLKWKKMMKTSLPNWKGLPSSYSASIMKLLLLLWFLYLIQILTQNISQAMYYQCFFTI